MCCDRPYRQALRRDIVTSELRRYAGGQFDPVVSKEFLALMESGPEDLDVTLLAETVTDAT